METLLANLSPDDQANEERGVYAARMRTLLFPLGLGLIASALKAQGRAFATYDSYVAGSLEGFYDLVRRERPSAVLMSGFLGNNHYPFVIRVSKRVKELSPDTVIVLGGPMATTIPHLLAAHSDADYIVVGEGEDTAVELIDALRAGRPVDQVAGLHLGRAHGDRFVGPRSRIRKLTLWPHYDAFPIQKYIDYLNASGKCWEISTSRGCWADCRFCKLTFGRRVTFYPLVNLVRHLRMIVEKYGVARFNFVDDNFLNSKARVREFLSLLRNECPPIRWRFQGRADAVAPEDVEEMMAHGLFDINFGLESGSQVMLERYGKRLNIERAIKDLSEIRKLLDFHATFIVGGPGESWDTIKQTESLIHKLRLGNAYFGILTLFPGTALYEEARANGLIPDEDAYCRSIGPIFEFVYTNISDLSDAELVEARDHLTSISESYCRRVQTPRARSAAQ